MSFASSAEFKVGLLVLIVSGLVAVMTISINEDPSYLNKARKHWFYLPDASGLVKNSPVRMAGIPIGVIKDIRLEEGQAHVEVVVRRDVVLHTSASVEIRANGILGDRYIEINPGKSSDPALESGAQIANVENKGSFDAVMNNVGQLSDSLTEVANALRDSFTGEGSKESPIGRTILNLEHLTADLADLSAGHKKDIAEILENLKSITGDINQFVTDDSDQGFKESWRKMAQSLGNVEKILHNVDEITSKINRGEGTIGKLVNDDRTVTELNEAIEGVNNFLGSANKLQTSVNLHSEFLAEQSMTKSYLGVRLQPGLDRYYEIQVIDDPKGVVQNKNILTTSGGVTTEIDERTTFKNKVKFTALFAKNFYDFTIKGGMMEDTGGVGAEYKFLRGRRMRVGLDAFDFSADTPHLRAFVRYNLLYGLFFVGGADDFLNKDTYSSYIGAGLDLTNDDLGMLFSKVPF